MNPSETAELMETSSKSATPPDCHSPHQHDAEPGYGYLRGHLRCNLTRIIAKGTPTEIQNNPEVIKAYLGGGKEG